MDISAVLTYFIKQNLYLGCKIPYIYIKEIKRKTMELLTQPLYESPRKEANEKKYGIRSKNQCVCCMKPMADNETLMVHMNENWMAVRADISEEDCEKLTGAKSQGYFNIGNACAKKMNSIFIIKQTRK